MLLLTLVRCVLCFCTSLFQLRIRQASDIPVPSMAILVQIPNFLELKVSSATIVFLLNSLTSLVGSSSMLIMAYAHAVKSGDGSLLERYVT
jgi:hypothetical protein